MDDIINAQGLRRTYGSTRGSTGFEAVRGVNLRVQRGELYALLGTNGAGKTSLLEVIEGIAPASGGTVQVLGHDPYTDRVAVRRHTGIMLQEGGFPADLKVIEMVRTWARTLTQPRDAEEVLTEVSLAHRQNVPVKSLSGGERRRLDLALAILGDPEVLFLDEPTTGLDPESRREAWELIRRLTDRGVTIMLTTHYLEEAEELADRIGIMHDGLLVREGTIAQIVADEPARINFQLPQTAPDLPALFGRHQRHSGAHGQRHTITTQRLQEDLRHLLDWAHRQDLHLENLDARAASLEQAFLAIAAESTTTDAAMEVAV